MWKLFCLLLPTLALGQSTTTAPCCPVKEYEGKSYKYVGVDPSVASSMGCDIPGSCIYSLEDGTGDKYCWQSAPGPMATCVEKPVQFDTVVIENGTVFVQSTEYDEDTGAITIKVPAHGNNEPIDVYMQTGADVMVVSNGDTCQIRSVPKEVDTTNAGNSTAAGNTTVTPESERTEYTVVTDEGPASQAEIDSMPAGAQTACADKKIRKTSLRTVTKEEFDRIARGEITSGGSTVGRRKRSTNCDLQRKCVRRGQSCWRTSFGGASRVDLHNLAVDMVCVDCCESGTSPEYCTCSDINSIEKLQNCSKPENGTCLAGFQMCNGTCFLKIRNFELNCNGTCSTGRKECGKYCIPQYWNYYRTCGDACIGKWESCNGECPEGYTDCQGRCISNSWVWRYFWNCSGECISKRTPCDGNCTTGYVPCGSARCVPSSSAKWYWTCNDTCLSKWRPCGDKCPDNYTLCGSNWGQYCVQDQSLNRYYWTCDGKCLSKWTPCNGTCPDGYTLCGNRCIRDWVYNRYYYVCNGTCLSKWRPCNGTCPSDRILCGTRCMTPQYFNRYFEFCNGRCQPKWWPCNTTPASSTSPRSTPSAASTTPPQLTSTTPGHNPNYNSPTTTPRPFQIYYDNN